MGVACKIHLRENGTVEMVEAPNGEISNLYKEALEYTSDPKQAINLWTLPYTIGFKEVNGNWENQLKSESQVQSINNKKGFNEGISYVGKVAQLYKNSVSKKGVSHNPVFNLNKSISTEMAKKYESIPESTTDPAVKQSYEYMIRETTAQYDFIVAKGLKVVKHEGLTEPYSNSKEMLKDLRDNNTLKFLPNETAFGQDTDINSSKNVGLQKSGRTLSDGYELTNSEVFRIVHDYFGHGILGNQFGAIGEENATLQHLDLFSDVAAPAVIFQTRGQNSWVNFSGVNKQAADLRKEARLLREKGNLTQSKKLLKQAESLFKFAEPKINTFPAKYNFKKYDTTRRIEEDQKINKLNIGTREPDSKLPSLLSEAAKRSSTKRGVNIKSGQGTTRRLGSFDVETLKEYNLDSSSVNFIKNVFPRFKGLQTIYEINDGQAYREMMQKALKDNKFKSSVTLHSAEDFSKMRLFVTEDGSTGITLDETGFLGGAFSDPNADRPNNLAALMVLGIKEGATTAEAFDTVLPDYYALFGFKAVSTVKFNDDFKPSLENGAMETWDYEKYKRYNNGRPDIVHLIYDGGERSTIEQRLGQFEGYNSYEKNIVKNFDKNGYQKSYNYMSKKFLNKYQLEQTTGTPKISQAGLNLDSNGEPKLKDVLNYLKNVRNQGVKLTNSDLVEIGNNLYSLPINNLEELYNEVRSTFYTNGVFEITEENLEKSKLYSELEVLDILSNPVLQKNIKSLIEKIETQFLVNNSKKFDELIKTYFYQDEDLIIDTSTNVGIGKHKTLNPFVIEKELSAYLAGIKNRSDFDNKVKDLPYEAIVAKYHVDTTFANKMYNRFSEINTIVGMKQEEQGLVKRTLGTSKSTLKEVLITDIPSLDITDDLFLLSRLDIELWENNIELIKEVLTQVENNLVPFNIDVIGLSDSVDVKTQAEVLEFINKLDIFVDSINQSNVTEETVDQLAEEIDSYFEVQVVSETVYENLTTSNKNRTIVKLTPTTDDLTLFKNNSLLRTKEGYFHKVNVIENINQLYDTVYNLVIRDNSILPKEAFYPTSFDSDNTFNLGKLNKPENKEFIKQDIKRFIEKEAYKYNSNVDSQSITDLKKMLIYKIIFKHPINDTNILDKNKEILKINAFNGDVGYLTTQYVSDFYNYQLENKVNKTELYENVLKHFIIDERGIVLNQSDLHTKQQINLLSPSNEVFNNLRQYVLISRESSLEGLFIPNTPQKIVMDNVEVQRKLTISNPEILEVYKGQYDTDGDLLITTNVNDSFLKTSKAVYEKISQHGNASFFRELPSFKNPYFKDYGLKVKNNTQIDLSKYSAYIIDKNNSQTQMNNLYTKSELDNINKQIDEC